MWILFLIVNRCREPGPNVSRAIHGQEDMDYIKKVAEYVNSCFLLVVLLFSANSSLQ